MNLLFVCTGNTCRSPMAAALASHQLSLEGGKEDVVITSAGLAVEEGSAAADDAVKTLRKHNIPFKGHQANQLTAEMVSAADHIFTMTEEQAKMVRLAFPFAAHKVTTYLVDQDIPDPFGGDAEAYDQAFSALAGGLPEVFKWNADMPDAETEGAE